MPILDADLVGEDSLVLYLDASVVIDDAFRDASNYVVRVTSGAGDIRIRAVIPPTDGLVTTQVILHIDKPTRGTTYELTVDSLRTRSGSGFAGNIKFVGRRTKLDVILSAVPNHWDKRPSSVMRGMLSAISIEDDRIGGERSDYLNPTAPLYSLAAEDEVPLLTESGQYILTENP